VVNDTAVLAALARGAIGRYVCDFPSAATHGNPLVIARRPTLPDTLLGVNTARSQSPRNARGLRSRPCLSQDDF
jgi:hypothetical protein